MDYNNKIRLAGIIGVFLTFMVLGLIALIIKIGSHLILYAISLIFFASIAFLLAYTVYTTVTSVIRENYKKCCCYVDDMNYKFSFDAKLADEKFPMTSWIYKWMDER